MKIPQTYIQKTKAGAHFVQAFLIFIGGCLALAVLTKDGKTGGQVGYYFALCFLTAPALVYQLMVPMWSRAWRFASVYAYAGLDILFTILWFAAFIAVAVWQGGGLDKGAKDKGPEEDDGACSHFAYGSEAKCNTSKASVGFGVVIFLLFALTSAISVYGVMRYRKTGVMPNGSQRKAGQAEHVRAEDPNKDAWSTNTDDLEPGHTEDYNDPRRAYGQIPTEDEDDSRQGFLHRPLSRHDDPFRDTHSMADSQTEEGDIHPGRAVSNRSNTSLGIAPPTSYHTNRPTGEGSASPTGYIAPSALSPSDYEHTPGGRVNFPQGNYGADLSYQYSLSSRV